MTTVTRLHGRPRKPCRRPGATTQPAPVIPITTAAQRRRATRFAAAWRADPARPWPASAS